MTAAVHRRYPDSDILDLRTPAEAADDVWHAVFCLLDPELGAALSGELAQRCADAVRSAREAD